MRYVTLFIVFGAMLLLAPYAGAQQHHGQVAFATSCADDVSATFNEAVALLHHMMYEQAEEQFQRVADADPSCAMAYWGIAMTQLHPLWAPPTQDELARGKEASKKANELGAPTDRERAFIEAISAFFQTEGDFTARLKAWEARQAKVHEAHQGDIDAAAFRALAQLAVAPRDDRTFAQQALAGERLEALHEQHPEHPGLFHYIIHSYDNPVLAERAVEVARGYDKLAPEVPHALHMPSHIFVRLGLWDDVAAWNRRSADAALKHPVGDLTSMHYPHALDYLVYGRLQQGRDDDASEAVREVLARDRYQPNLAAAYGLAAPPARLALERRAWSDAAALPVREPASFPWASFPAAESITWFAKGLGSARTGDVSAGRTAIERLDELHAALIDAGETYWAVHTDAQRRAIEAWIHYEEGNAVEALEMMRQAADIEDSVDKHPVTPGSVLPMRELLGEMLLLEDSPAAALDAFTQTLSVSPRRLNSLSGAGRAAELAGDPEAADRYYRQVAEVAAGHTTIDRPRMAEAHAYLNGR